jgi:ribosomal subunit interface protein
VIESLIKQQPLNLMKLNLRFLGSQPNSAWRDQMEKQFNQLSSMASISTANVALEQRQERKPRFRVQALLAIPGPDIHAEAREHTFQAALRKVIEECRRQIQTRKSKQLRNRHHRHWRNWSGALARRGA